MFENEIYTEQIGFGDLIKLLFSKIGFKNIVLGLALVFLCAYLIYFNFFQTEDTSLVLSEVQNENDFEAEFVTVDLSGAVQKPGVYKLAHGAVIADLLALGEGFLSEVSAKWVAQNLNLSQKLVDAQKVYVPFAWDFGQNQELNLKIDLPTELPSLIFDAPQNPTPPIDDNDNTNLISLNTADQIELESLPGVGSVTAKKIIDNRPYQNFSEFKQKTGISDSVIEKIEDLVTF